MEINSDVSKYLAVLMCMTESIRKAGFEKDVVLTGGFGLDFKLIENGLPELCRRTRDIDLSIQDIETYLRLFDNIEDVLNTNSNGFRFTLVKRRGLHVDSDSVTLECYVCGEKLIVKIDMNIKDLRLLGVSFLDKLPLPVYDDYTAIVDKLSVIYSHRIYRRIKDMYDIYCYSMMCDLRYSRIYQQFSRYRNEVLGNLELMLLPDNLSAIEHAYMQNDALPKSKFDDVFTVSSSFSNKLFMLLVNKEVGEYVWDRSYKAWRELV